MSKPGGKGSNEGGTDLGTCLHKGCKTKVSRFGFCNEHFAQFKFGLIKKDGSPVMDFEKKNQHYLAMKKRQSGVA